MLLHTISSIIISRIFFLFFTWTRMEQILDSSPDPDKNLTLEIIMDP